MTTRRDELVCATEAAVAVALSVVLGNIRLLELPSGGSIALATLPLLALGLTRGVRTAALACSCAGAAHALAGGTIIHPAQLLLDYVLAYGVLAVAGLAPRRASASTRRGVIIVAMTLHLSMMVVSGVIFFAPVAGAAAWLYAISYNAATVVPEALLALWLVPILVRAIARAHPASAWRSGLVDPPRRAARTPRHAASSPSAPARPHPTASRLPPPPRIVRRAAHQT